MSRETAARASMALLVRRARAYFAPVERATATPAPFDAVAAATFALDEPPTPWIDLGWIERLNRSGGTRVEQMRAGTAGAAVAQFRSGVDARVEFDFLEWGKLQMALAAGGEHRNVLCGAAVPVFEGSTAANLSIGDAAANFSAGDMVAVDADYAGETGYVGTGIAGSCLRSAVQNDLDYVRRVTFNVARVLNVSGDALVLAQALIGGAPRPGAGVQKVAGFVDHEGGSFFQEWSALFAAEADSGARVLFYYPRLQACAPAAETAIEVAASLDAIALHASFVALSWDVDGESVLCQRIFVPAAGAPVY